MTATRRQQQGTGVAYSYVRFSSPQQAKGDSLRRQTERAEEYCRANGLRLDSASYRDLGVSGFRGANATEGALSSFLAAVKAGKIERGSTLIVEHLDRLSRNQISKALPLFIGLCENGIQIVTLIDGRVYNQDSVNNPADLVYSLMLFAQAHEQSQTKSDRVAASWTARRRAAAEGKTTNRHLPAWLRREGNRYVLVPETAAVVRQIFDWAAAGYGITAIAQRLNEAGVPTFGYSAQWSNVSVRYILHDRKVIGQYQPTKLDWSNGIRGSKPVGEPVKGYYPAVVTEEQFYSVQKAMGGRLQTGGPVRKAIVNIWNGVLVDAKGRTICQTRRGGAGGTSKRPIAKRRVYIVQEFITGGRPGPGEQRVSFPSDEFDAAVFCRITNPATLAASEQTTAAQTKVAAIEQQLAELTTAIDAFQTKVAANPATNVELVMETLLKWQTQRDGLRQQLEEAKAAAAPAPVTAADIIPRMPSELAKLVDGLGAGTLDNERRLALREFVRGCVRQIRVAFERKGITYYRCHGEIELLDGRRLPLDFALRGTRKGQNKVTFVTRWAGISDADIAAGLGEIAARVATAARKRPATPPSSPVAASD